MLAGPCDVIVGPIGVGGRYIDLCPVYPTVDDYDGDDPGCG
jgi:hypothetical protein